MIVIDQYVDCSPWGNSSTAARYYGRLDIKVVNHPTILTYLDGTIHEIGSCQENEENSPYLCQDPALPCEIGFDPVFQVCTWRSEVQCLPTCESFALSSFCYDNTCTKYVLCYYGRPVLRECHDNLQYNNATDRCDFPQYVDCVANDCSATNQPENIIYLASKASCNKYFVCSNGRPWEQECAPGLAYNPACECCDFEENVNCSVSWALLQSILNTQSMRYY